MWYQRPATGHAARALGFLICVCAMSCVHADNLDARKQYQRALVDLRAGRIEQFRSAQRQLTDYPLYPYLEFEDLQRQLRRATPQQIQSFIDRNSTTPLAERLRQTWLSELARRGEWQHFLDFYTQTDDAQLQCLYLRALLHTGADAKAMAQVAPLWTVATSQPKACDPLFDQWIADENLTVGIVWQRLTLALQARQWQLARYLIGLLNPELKPQAELLYQVYRDPQLITQLRRFRSDDTLTRETVALGIRRLANTDPQAAATAWATYQRALTFSADEARVVAQDLTIGAARHGTIDLQVDLSPTADGRHVLVFEALLLAAIGAEAWPAVVDLVNRIDEAERSKPRWQYWLGRALRALSSPSEDDAVARDAPWTALAAERQYYGFLAAEGLGITPALNDRSTAPDEATLAALRALPAFIRLEELYAVGDLTNARRELNVLAPQLDADVHGAAAYQLAQIGWIYQSIMAANAADLRDALALRFPNPFLQPFRRASHATGVPLSFLYAVARQESAFALVARSPAGALGLMQLMPATAAATARARGDKPPSTADLYQAEINITVGSQHLADLLKRYDGNRVLVAAAYNAGPHRADRWLHERDAHPADIWIETIPFFETRNYVMNVLAFSYVYGQRLDRPTPFLTTQER